jgi:hypothetical protein
MGIFDDAIREHLELKRQHGAGGPELKQLEDEAFGPPERPGGGESPPDPFAEAPTEFMAAPETAEGQAPEGEPQARREPPGIADLQEALPPAEPVEEEQPAMEHEVVPELPHSTEERHAIAEQPTEMFDVEGEIAASESSSPSDEELVEEEIVEPRLAPVDPLAGLEAAEAEAEIEVSAAAEDESDEDEDDDFWNEQRLSDELDQALEAPAEEPEAEAVEVEEAGEADAEEVVEDLAVEDEDEGEPGTEPGGAPSRDREDDVLEDTPDFLEDSEDDELWFEQKPPKDFDFDD